MTIFKIYAVSLGLQLLAWPTIRKIFRKLPDEGWVLGRLCLTLVCALVIWQLSYLGLGENSLEKIYALLSLFGLVSLWIVFTDGVKAFTVSRGTLKLIVIEEYLFLIGLTLMALIRAHAPSLDSLEKFMDFGFLKQYIVSPTLPAPDMWQAGKTINYYSFGHYWASVLVRVWGVEASIGYNMVLAFIFGTSLSLVFLLCVMISGKKNSRGAAVGGIFGALAVMVAGNSHVIWYLIKNKSINDYWYAEATRFIHNTIHEFPGYSFVVSDLHGHVLDLPVVLAFLLIVFLWIEHRSRLPEIGMGLLLGVMMMTNTWDVAVYGLVLVLVGIQQVADRPEEIKKLMVSASVVLLTMALVAMPWWLSFVSISNGVGIVKERSPLWQLVVLWGGGLTINIIALITEGKGENKVMVRTLALTSILLIIIPEFVYARDIYPNHPRANTMFKLTYQAFIMMGVLLGTTLGKLIQREEVVPWWWRFPALYIIFGVFVGTMVFPIKAFSTYYRSFSGYYGLSGRAWLERSLPEKDGAIRFLEEHKNGKNLIEAVGDSYTLLNVVSVFSGVPAVQGWRVHEWLWRGGYEPVAEREADVREVYQGKDIQLSKNILNKYAVGWILISGDEKISYKVNEEKLWQLGKVVWAEGDAYILKVE